MSPRSWLYWWAGMISWLLGLVFAPLLRGAGDVVLFAYLGVWGSTFVGFAIAWAWRVGDERRAARQLRLSRKGRS